MNSKAKNIITELNLVKKNLNRPLIIIETGTIRNVTYDETDGHSTRYIAEWVRDNRGEFYSIDLSIKKANDFLTEQGLNEYVTLMQGRSTELLPYTVTCDFVYLDSENNAELTLAEFKLTWDKVSKGGAVMVDDCSLKSAELKKGDLLIPYLNENNIPFKKCDDTFQIVIYK